MSAGDDTIRSLREAVNLSPENLPLRQHLAQTLVSMGRFEEAEQELRQTLKLAPNNVPLKVALANAYYQQEKHSQAMVIVEDVMKRQDAPAEARVLYARLLLRAGDVPNAVAQYKAGVELDAGAGDDELAERLGVVPEEEAGEVFEGRVRESWQEGGDPPGAEIERPKIKFDDVGGMEVLKEEIGMKIIYPLQHPEMYQAYGKEIGGGILMYGPPGCGKTHLARATAGEIKAGFLSIGINDVLEMWIGSSERNLHELFESARRNRPCVLFFDEVDALGASRTDMKGSAGRHL
ncbi:MAG: AAA family ATPase, partial [Candidatus Nealsonbacteria bacterium]|nr:AAA family ATPase [Candidatus Nealsonbacteria bacterium]